MQHNDSKTVEKKKTRILLSRGTYPRFFGRPGWVMLRACASKVRSSPERDAFRRLCKFMPELLPCSTCAAHFTQQMIEHPISDTTNLLEWIEDAQRWVTKTNLKEGHTTLTKIEAKGGLLATDSLSFPPSALSQSGRLDVVEQFQLRLFFMMWARCVQTEPWSKAQTQIMESIIEVIHTWMPMERPCHLGLIPWPQCFYECWDPSPLHDAAWWVTEKVVDYYSVP